MKDKLSEKEKQILLFISSFFERNGFPPTVREIGKGVGLKSSCTVHYHLKKLEQKGVLRRRSCKPRAIELVMDELVVQSSVPGSSDGEGLVQIPLVKDVYYVNQKPVFEEVETLLFFPRSLVGKGEFFAFRVPDNRLVSLNLLKDDYLIVKKGETLFCGDLGLFFIDDEVCIRKVRDNQRYSEKKKWWEIDFWDDRYSAIGKVVGVWRKL
ncbi:MAG: repressor LexA [Candidatus Atribacteria bacterium]|jgi:repressor LexA|nr:repressor LexA [Candidatus Atribacteria bacterium]